MYLQHMLLKIRKTIWNFTPTDRGGLKSLSTSCSFFLLLKFSKSKFCVKISIIWFRSQNSVTNICVYQFIKGVSVFLDISE